MCKKDPNECKAKIKCRCCKEKLAIEQEDGKLNLNEVDNNFEQQHYVIDVKGENKMKFKQVFDNYKIVIDFSYGHGYDWKISVVENEYRGSEVLNVTKCERGVKVGTSRTLPVDGALAFELANMYQEALALANTKNLSVDLLLELGYNVVK